MPTPRTNETESEFIQRCIPVVIEDGTAENEQQATAICYSIWENREKNMKKIFNPYETKNLNIEVKDLDAGSRQVKFYASAFNIKDSDNDIIRPGAFLKSINERGVNSASNRKIAFLRNHDWDRMIGKLVEISEDNYGLLVVGKLGNSTKGNDALFDYQDGILREHSIGFNYVPDKIKLIENEEDENDYYWDVTEVYLWETSAVTFGANQFTPVIDVAKGMTKQSELDKLNNEMSSIMNGLKNGKGTDERLHSLEMRLKVIQTKYNSLITLEPHCTKCTHKGDEPNKVDEQKQFYINLLNKKL